MAEKKPTPEEIERLQKKMKEEYEAIVRAIGRVTTMWSMLENNLYSIFAELSKMGNTEIAGVIFYTPTNMETRISLVDALFTYRFELRAMIESDKVILGAWDKIRGKINTLKQTRNLIAHGTLMHSSTHSVLSQRPRLSPAFRDTLDFYQQLKAGQHPGLGSAEIETHHDAVGKANDRVVNLLELVRLQSQLGSGLDPKKAERRLELLSQLDTKKPDQNSQDQAQQGKAAPDQSSPA